MSSTLPNNNNNTETEQNIPETDGQSTIFCNPEEHNDKPAVKSSVSIKKILAAVLAVTVLCVGVFAAVKLLPEKTDDETQDNTISVLEIPTSQVQSIEVNNQFGKLTMLTEIVENDDESEIVWKIKGVNEELTSSSSIEDAATNVLSISALREVGTDAASYGFDDPVATATVKSRDNAFEDYTVYIGDNAPGSMGTYCKLSTSDKIYLVNSSLAESLQCDKLDFAVTTGFEAVEQTTANSSCFTSGSITSFDSLTISGKLFKDTVKIVPQTDESVNSYFAYKVTAPTIRIGNNDNIETMLGFFSSGISSSGAYAYSPTDKQLKEYGLDNPDAVVTLRLAGENHTFKISGVDEDFCALIDENAEMIHKIPRSTVTFIDYKTEDFYSNFIFLENLSGLSALKAEIGDSTYNFELKFTEGDDDTADTYQAFFGGNELDIANFKKFYQHLIGLTPVDYSSKNLKTTSMKITLTHSAGTKDTVLSFKPYSAQRYQVELDGIPMGLITSASYEKVVENIKKASTNETIS